MWKCEGRTVSVQRFERFEPAEVLYEFDSPRIFTLEDAEGKLNLAYWSDEDKNVCRYVVVPTTLQIVDALRKGSISVYDALNQPRCWLCNVKHDGGLAECRRADFANDSPAALPAIGTMLLPSLEPLLTLRAIGDEIVPGRIPGSVIRNSVEGVQKTFKFLSEYVLGQQPQAGRPRRFYVGYSTCQPSEWPLLVSKFLFACRWKIGISSPQVARNLLRAKRLNRFAHCSIRV